MHSLGFYPAIHNTVPQPQNICFPLKHHKLSSHRCTGQAQPLRASIQPCFCFPSAALRSQITVPPVGWAAVNRLSLPGDHSGLQLKTALREFEMSETAKQRMKAAVLEQGSYFQYGRLSVPGSPGHSGGRLTRQRKTPNTQTAPCDETSEKLKHTDCRSPGRGGAGAELFSGSQRQERPRWLLSIAPERARGCGAPGSGQSRPSGLPSATERSREEQPLSEPEGGHQPRPRAQLRTTPALSPHHHPTKKAAREERGRHGHVHRL